MSNGLDCSTSNLFCSESIDALFDDNNECNDADECGFSPSLTHLTSHSDFKVIAFNNNGSDSFGGFPLQDEETVRRMVENEREHLPAEDYLRRLRSGVLNLNIRRVAFNWIWQAHSYWGFGPLSFVLATNYFDRFVSMHDFPSDIEWVPQLLAVACLSLAAKLEDNKVPHCVDLQVAEPRFVFEGKTIHRMELMLLRKLRWRMLAITPCSFIEYFLSKLNDGRYPSITSLSRSVQLIVSTTRGSAGWEMNAGTDFLEFRPSEIAAAVAIYISGEQRALESDKSMSYFVIVEKGRVMKCLELMRGLSLTNGCANGVGAPPLLVPQSPAGVLDGTCLSFKSES